MISTGFRVLPRLHQAGHICYSMGKMKTTAAQTTTPTNNSGEGNSSSARANFIVLALNMTWQLLIVVLVPVIGGVKLDKTLDSGALWTLVGLAVALIASVLVIARTARLANTYPVPKLTDAERKAVQQRIAEDDKEADS